jgi:hypothetical protein
VANSDVGVTSGGTDDKIVDRHAERQLIAIDHRAAIKRRQAETLAIN